MQATEEKTALQAGQMQVQSQQVSVDEQQDDRLTCNNGIPSVTV
jgi:hypothetical protein